LFHCTDAIAYSDAHFGQDVTIIIALVDVACTVYESRLIDCPHDNNTGSCSHSDDAGAECVPRELLIVAFIAEHDHFVTFPAP